MKKMTQTTMDFSSNYGGQKEAAEQHFLVLKKKNHQHRFNIQQKNKNNNNKNPSK